MQDFITLVIIAYLFICVLYFMKTHDETWPGFDKVEETVIDTYDNIIDRNYE